MDKKTAEQAEMLGNRLRKRSKHLSKWARRRNVGVWRLYDRDIPEVPLVLDFYTGAEKQAVVGALYKRPFEKDAAEEHTWLDAMKEAAAQALGLESSCIYLKERRRIVDRHEQYDRLAEAGNNGGDSAMVVEEGGLHFRVDLASYLDTGLFPDRRLLRARIRDEAAGKRFLNLFAYTASFSVYAAAGGAVSTDSVDLSATYLAWAAENFRLNTMQNGEGTNNRLYRADTLRYLRSTRRKWDIIMLDPPTFSASKKMTAADGSPVTWDVKRDAAGLCKLCLEHLETGGKLYLSVNARGFHLNREKLPQATIRDITQSLIDKDFEGRRAPVCYEIQTLSS